jgi:diaminopimelate epimerase
MELELHFVKYTSLGNTFIIVDETLTPLGGDRQRAAFARWALNPDFGIGGTDNVLYLRRAEPAEGPADFVFRIFEHDGTETLSCGNGLLATAAVLHGAYGGHRWGVLTELPTGRPQLVHIGVHGGVTGSLDETWVNTGRPRAVPAELVNRAGAPPASGIDPIDELRVPLPHDATWAGGLPATLTLSGFLVFTGEPHLVLLSGAGLPASLEEHLYPADRGRAPASSLLIEHIGAYVNATYRDLFPHGVHLNFARIRDSSGLVEYRTYERAIDRETLACGSGAVALTFVAQRLGLLARRRTVLWPHRCRWSRPEARLTVEETESGFVLTGRPRRVCAGVASPPHWDSGEPTAADDHRIPPQENAIIGP